MVIKKILTSLHWNLSFQKKIAAFFILTAIVLTVIFYAIAINSRHSAHTANLVEHAQKMLLHTEKVETEIDKIQSDARAYIITGDERYLDLYKSTYSGIYRSLANIKELTKGYAVQQANVDSLTLVVGEVVRMRYNLVQARKAGGFEAAKGIFTAAEAESSGDRARRIIRKLQLEENRFFVESKAANTRSIRDSFLIITVFILVMILLLVAAFLVISKNTKLRAQAEAEIRSINASLVQTVEEKTREVIEKERRHKLLIENMREGIQIIGFDWTYLFVNDSAARQCRYSREELIGHSLTGLYPGIADSCLFKNLEFCMMEREPVNFENEFIYPDGSRCWFELSIQPVDEGISVLSIDITSRKAAEFKLAQQQLRQQKLLAEMAIDVQERERDELGKELHDNINQILTSVQLCLEMATTEEDHAKELVERSYQQVGKAICEIRKLSHSLVSPSLGEVTFDCVMQNLAMEASLVNGLRVEFVNRSGAGTRLDKSKELMLYRIAQEQINNIRKYSKAKNAVLTLNKDKANIILTISDNGVGFDPSKKAKGIGLKNVKSRLEFYSGKMKLIAAPGQGCTLEVMVPV